jgi:hypothetical protein
LSTLVPPIKLVLPRSPVLVYILKAIIFKVYYLPFIICLVFGVGLFGVCNFRIEVTCGK